MKELKLNISNDEVYNFIKQLVIGINEEKEHTEGLVERTQIALDHLREDEQYYSKLKSVMDESVKQDPKYIIDMINSIKRSAYNLTDNKSFFTYLDQAINALRRDVRF